MTDKEKLIEIFKKIEYTAFPDMTLKANLANQFTEYALNTIADEMIKHNIIMPPCKVGDKLYRIVELLNGERFVVDGIALEYTETFEWGTTKKRIYFWASGDEYTSRHHSIWLEISEFGKTVFLTREEAEKALEN